MMSLSFDIHHGSTTKQLYLGTVLHECEFSLIQQHLTKKGEVYAFEVRKAYSYDLKLDEKLDEKLDKKSYKFYFVVFILDFVECKRYGDELISKLYHPHSKASVLSVVNWKKLATKLPKN